MDWKQITQKVIKGAVTGALAAITGLSMVGIPPEKMGAALVGAALSGALHGIANALEQKKGA